VPALLVGAGLSDASQAASAAQRVRLVRMGLTWPPAATAPDATTTAALQSIPSSASAVVELTASPLPVDDAGRAALAQYAAAVVAQVPKLHALVLAPAPASSTGPDYVAAVAAIRTALPETPLGIAVDGSTDPGDAVATLTGAAVEFVAFRPAPTAGSGLWTLADLDQIRDGFPDAQIIIDGAPAPYAATLKAVACTPDIAAVVLDRVSDLTRVGVPAAIQTAQRGGFVCPGGSFDALPFTVEYPTALSPQPIRVSFNCNRDCLYLVTLNRADGRPELARRGQIEGGPERKPTVIALPKTKLRAGTYTIDVRLVARVNPGTVTRYAGPPLTIG
jgi:hypothetical protein